MLTAKFFKEINKAKYGKNRTETGIGIPLF